MESFSTFIEILAGVSCGVAVMVAFLYCAVALIESTYGYGPKGAGT